MLSPLPWDTDFFGVTIARAAADTRNLDDTIHEARRAGVECLVLTVEAADPATINVWTRTGARIVDLRVELGRHAPLPDPTGNTRMALAADRAGLEADSLQLIPFSRFYRDSRFPDASVEDLYRVWMRRCLDDGIVVVSDSLPSSFVGARVENGEARIDLVYVAPANRGRSAARMLIADAIAALGLERAVIVTQAGNIAIHRTCQSLGFRTRRVQAILHLWLDESAHRSSAV